MEKSQNYRSPFLGLLSAVCLGGALSCCSTGGVETTPCDSQPRNHVIDVDSVVGCKAAHVSKNADHQITWRSKSATKLEVEFADKTAFPKLHCPKSEVCKSGRIGHDVQPGTYAYKVWLTKDGARKEVDPNIIIHP